MGCPSRLQESAVHRAVGTTIGGGRLSWRMHRAKGPRSWGETLLAGFDQLARRLTLSLGGVVGVGFLHEVAGQHIGIEPDHGRNRLAASKSTGTGGSWLLRRPKPLPASSKQMRLPRAKPSCWRR